MNTNFGAKLSHEPKIFLLGRAPNPPDLLDKKTDPSTELGAMGLFFYHHFNRQAMLVSMPLG